MVRARIARPGNGAALTTARVPLPPPSLAPLLAAPIRAHLPLMSLIRRLSYLLALTLDLDNNSSKLGLGVLLEKLYIYLDKVFLSGFITAFP